MKLSILKWLCALTASTLLFGASNTSEEIADCCAPPAPAKSCCPPKPCCVPAKIKPMPPCDICQDPCCPPMAVYNRNVNPPAHCMGQCANDIFVTGAFLWWLPDEADFSLGFNQKTPYVASSTGVAGSNVNGNLIQFNLNWEPGFRVGLGWQSHTAEGWDVYLDWTWYKNKTNQSATAANTAAGAGINGQGIIPFWALTTDEESDFIFGQMNGTWRLLYNMIDIELGRDFFVSCALSLRPYISVEGGWIHRKWSVNYSGILTSLDTTFGSNSYSSKSNYWGVGPRAGLGGNWWLGQGFKFFGNFSGSLLSGRVVKNVASLATNDTLGIPSESNNWSNNQIFRVVPHLQAVVGAGWDFCFCCEQYRFGITAGWEVNQFWNVPMVIYPDINGSFAGTLNTSITNRESRTHNLALSGLNVEARFDF